MSNVSIPTLKIKALPSRNKPGQVFAFIEKQLCFFEMGTPIPEAGKEVEVMITRPLYRRRESYDEKATLLALLIRQPTEKDFLLYHSGFECSGTVCTTTSTIRRKDQPQTIRWPEEAIGLSTGDLFWATPGRTHIKAADNVNVRYGDTPNPLHPGWAYFSKFEGRYRCEGLLDFRDGDYASLVRTK